MLWACVLLPQLALDGVLRRRPQPVDPVHPELAEGPLALVTGPVQKRVLAAVNPAAARAGLHAGQALAAAHAVLSKFATVEYDAADVARWRDFLAAWAYRYSSQVSIAAFNGMASDAIVLEIEASLGLFGPWPLFERQLRDDLTALGFSHRIAVAPTARAAWVLAGMHDGLALAQQAILGNALARIPVAQARLDTKTAQALHAMGLRRLGQLFAAPRASLAQRFGIGLLEHLDRLRGMAPDPFPLYRPPDRFDLRLELGWDIESSQALLFPLRRMTSDLAAFLAGRDGGVQRFVLRLEHEDHPDSEVVVGLLAAERDPALLFDLARGRLEQAQIPAPVRGMRLIAEELPPFVPAGRELFDERSSQAMPWTILRERLRARLGNEAVYALAPADDHRPEQAWRRTPLPVETRSTVESGPRPTWLLPRPMPLRDHAPRPLAGPERVESGWWDGYDIRRDYYVVQTSSGQRAWAFRGAGEAATPFMLHGWFA